MDEEHYTAIDHARARFDQLAEQLEEARDQLHTAVRDAFPETAGDEPKRGVLAEAARRAKFSREYVAQIRDGKVASS